MKETVIAATVGFVAVGVLNLVLTPMQVVMVGVALAVGIAAHELVHLIVAYGVGAESVRLVWNGQPEVRYAAPPPKIRLVNIAPTVLGLAGVLAVLLLPSDSLYLNALRLALATGLIGFSPEDWSLRRATNVA